MWQELNCNASQKNTVTVKTKRRAGDTQPVLQFSSCLRIESRRVAKMSPRLKDATTISGTLWKRTLTSHG